MENELCFGEVEIEKICYNCEVNMEMSVSTTRKRPGFFADFLDNCSGYAFRGV